MLNKVILQGRLAAEPELGQTKNGKTFTVCSIAVEDNKLIDGKRMQRFTPRKKNSPWTELNKERVRRLEKLGLMTEEGRAVLPPMGARSFQIDPDIEAAMKAARCWSKFKSFPPLYQRVRAYNVAF